jgi:hypothetical protein
VATTIPAGTAVFLTVMVTPLGEVADHHVPMNQRIAGA